MKSTPRKRPPSLMAVGAHADDIENQAGGTLEKYFRHGYEIVYVMSTNNMSGSVASLDADGNVVAREEPTTEMMARRKRECANAAREWNTEAIHLDYPQRHYRNEKLEMVELRYGAPVPPTTTADTPSIITAGEDPTAVEGLVALILKSQPECIFTHTVATHNPEHFGTALLVTNAYWKAWERGYRGGLLYWVDDDTNFGPAFRRFETYVDCSPFLDRKMELIGKHECQMPHWRRPDFGHRIVALEWGKVCGCLAAETFIWCNRPVHTEEGRPPEYGSLTLELYQNER